LISKKHKKIYEGAAMSENAKKMIALGAVLFVLSIFAVYSIFIFALNSHKVQAPLQPYPVETDALSASAPASEITLSSIDNRPVGYMPTAEEINQSIEDRTKKREVMKELIAARNKKAEKVTASAIAVLSSPASETAAEDTLPALSPEARDARNKELHEGIKAHKYFPH
jgi:predicted metal-dependent phosphoesterase TrpH